MKYQAGFLLDEGPYRRFSRGARALSDHGIGRARGSGVQRNRRRLGRGPSYGRGVTRRRGAADYRIEVLVAFSLSPYTWNVRVQPAAAIGEGAKTGGGR